MPRTTRTLLITALASLAVALTAAPAMAGKTGPNNANAKLCQKNGWQTLYKTTAPYTFADGSECTSYAAQGGALLTSPPSNAFIDACNSLATKTGVIALSSGPPWTCSFAYSGPEAGGAFGESSALEAACTAVAGMAVLGVTGGGSGGMGNVDYSGSVSCGVRLV